MAEAELDLAALEALIFSADGPLAPSALRRAFPRVTPLQLAAGVAQINVSLLATGRPYEIAEIAGGYQFRTRPSFAEVILAATPERKMRLSRPALETLALIAYKQPLTRAEIEDLRSVDCGAVVKSLLERDLVRIVGRRDAPGRPALYGTSSTFLETFGLRALTDLPALREIEAIVAAPSEDALLEESALEAAPPDSPAAANPELEPAGEEAPEGEESLADDPAAGPLLLH
ncbi:MAG TPA: SMC-Scp complex subunit ScpB [Myxococcota bacterium]|nr:SMC-Scp complex subunit ScpB [Myxococcota bacterium]